MNSPADSLASSQRATEEVHAGTQTMELRDRPVQQPRDTGCLAKAARHIESSSEEGLSSSRCVVLLCFFSNKWNFGPYTGVFLYNLYCVFFWLFLNQFLYIDVFLN